MIEKPDLPDELVIACLRNDYGLRAGELHFLPLGADSNTAVYRAVAGDGLAYFVKLRRSTIKETSVRLPKFLKEHGIPQIIAPLETTTGCLWADLPAFKLILYPFIEGRNGYEFDLADRHWIIFGKALKSIHTANLPASLRSMIQPETYSDSGRATVKALLERIKKDTYDEPVARRLVAFLKTKSTDIRTLVARTDSLAKALQSDPPELIVCHSDIHAGNILIDFGDNFYIVDWDDPILAPKERDLMFAGGGQFGYRRTPDEEEDLFYRGYGTTRINPMALAYYRYERIVQDIAVDYEQILSTDQGGLDREQSLKYLESNFLPNGTLAIARKSDQAPRMD